jgi:aminoacrylate hydrolase
VALVDISGGGTLHYELVGSGPSLALLLPQSKGPLGLGPLINALARYHTVLTYDQRGTGASSDVPEALSIVQQASDVIKLLDMIGIERTALLCHSTGCGIGISAAASNPDRIGALMLAAPWTYADMHLTTMQNLRVAVARTLEPSQYAHFNAALLYPPEFRRVNQAGFQQMADDASANPQDAKIISQRLDAILAFDARPLLPTIKSPTLVTTAKDDQLMPSWFAAEAAQAITNAELVQLDGGGHMLLETRTMEFTELALTFLARHSAAS